MIIKTVLVSSGYGGNTKKPFVMIEGDQIDEAIQMSPDEARDMALNLLSCADAAESDAFIVEFTMKELKSDERHARVLLVEFRKFREKMRGKVE